MLTSTINKVYQGSYDIHAHRAGQSREWFHERIRDKDCLLITAGDSWTWGDSLGNIDIGNNCWDDYTYRTTHTYGYHLSNMLDTDWVNIGICGGCNLFIIQETYQFIQNIEKEYKRIIVVFTLTELGRELLDAYNYDHRVQELYQALNNYKSLDDLLIKYESYTFNLIKELFDSCIVTRNFTHTFEENKSILGSNLLDKTWTEVIAEQGNLKPYPNVKLLSHIGIDPLLKFAKNVSKEQCIYLIDNQELGYTWLENSPYNSNAGTKHPNEQAHRWWAEHLYKHITNENIS